MQSTLTEHTWSMARPFIDLLSPVSRVVETKRSRWSHSRSRTTRRLDGLVHVAWVIGEDLSVRFAVARDEGQVNLDPRPPPQRLASGKPPLATAGRAPVNSYRRQTSRPGVKQDPPHRKTTGTSPDDSMLTNVSTKQPLTIETDANTQSDAAHKLGSVSTGRPEENGW